MSIISNGLLIFDFAAKLPNVNLIGLGGVFYPGTCSFFSPDMINTVRELHVDKAFLGCTGFTLEGGLFNMSFHEPILKHAVIEQSDRVVLMADSTKFGKEGLRRVCGFDRVQTFITNAPPTTQVLAYCEAHGMEVLYPETAG